MKIHACIFDMDGVIVDSARYHFKAWCELALDLGIDFTEADNEALKGLSRVDSLELILQKGNLFLDNDTKLALMERKNAQYLGLIAAMTPEEVLPGVREFLIELDAQGIRIALGSSSRNATKILEAVNLSEFFDVVIDGNKVTYSKPDPEVFLKGAEEMNVKPETTVVFEDALSGIEAARAGGFRVIGVGKADVLTTAEAVIPGFDQFDIARLESLLNL